jgi:quinol monooxygenase YgiN
MTTGAATGDDMALTLGLLATLKAKRGKEQELADFLFQGQALAAAEEGTRTWYAFRVDESTFGIFDTFEDEDARQAHLNGQIPQALSQVGPELLAADPDIKPVEILASKP